MRGRKKISVFEFDSSTGELTLRSTSPGVSFCVVNDRKEGFNTIPAVQDKVTIEVPREGAPRVTLCPDNVRVHFVKPGEEFNPPKEEEDGSNNGS